GSVEISTKVLEYSSLGLPVLLNPTTIQRRLMGADYPGYIGSVETFAQRFLELATSSERYELLSAAVRRAAEPFTFDAPRAPLAARLAADAGRPHPPRRRRLLFVGHDLKFARPLIAHYDRHPDYRVVTETYRGHVISDVEKSAALLHESDVVFCEWAL